MGKRWVRVETSAPLQSADANQSAPHSQTASKSEPGTKQGPKVFRGRANVWKRDASAMASPNENAVGEQPSFENDENAKRRRLMAKGRLYANGGENAERSSVHISQPNGHARYHSSLNLS